MKKVHLLFVFLLCTLSLYAQDPQTEARILYNQAEELLNEGKYKESLQKLTNAEEVLSTTNPKILYLKIQNYDRIVSSDWNESKKLQTLITTFFETVDKSTYSPEKYLEISSISLKLKDKTQLYEAEFTKLSSGNNYDGYKKFVNEFPNSDYSKRLRTAYQEKIDDEVARVKREKYIERVVDIKNGYKPKMKRLMNGLKLSLIFTGVYGILGGIFYIIDPYVQTDGVLKIVGISFLGISGVPALCSVGYGISIGALKAKQNRDINKLEVSIPHYNLRQNTFQTGLRYRF